ncbi:fatty acid cis/trans isomerase [Pseudoalteromonas sp. Hal099]
MQRALSNGVKGFTPVLNERDQNPEANLAGGVLFNSLVLKQSAPLPENEILDDEFDFSLSRSQTCAYYGGIRSFSCRAASWRYALRFTGRV